MMVAARQWGNRSWISARAGANVCNLLDKERLTSDYHDIVVINSLCVGTVDLRCV